MNLNIDIKAYLVEHLALPMTTDVNQVVQIDAFTFEVTLADAYEPDIDGLVVTVKIGDRPMVRRWETK